MCMLYTLQKHNPHSAKCHDVAWFELNGYMNSHNTTYYTAPLKKNPQWYMKCHYIMLMWCVVCWECNDYWVSSNFMRPQMDTDKWDTIFWTNDYGRAHEFAPMQCNSSHHKLIHVLSGWYFWWQNSTQGTVAALFAWCEPVQVFTYWAC